MINIPFDEQDYWENRYEGDPDFFEFYHRFQEFEEQLGDVLKS